jgi:transcription elongation GreA/GreB family factor
MLKAKLLEQIAEQLKVDLKAAIEAAMASHEAATHEESKPENQYDTRALEASYLAGAQAKRAGELEEVLAICARMNRANLSANAPVQAGALVNLDLNGQKKTVFLLPKGGGMTFKMDEQTVQIITPASPLGEAIVGLSEGDVAQVEVGGDSHDCAILSVQ